MKKQIKELLEWAEFYLIDKPKTWYWNVRWYIRNRIQLDRVLRDFRTWDAQYALDTFAFCLQQVEKDIEQGYEEPVARMKKVFAIKKLIYEILRDVEQEAMDEVYGPDYDFGVLLEGNIVKTRDDKEAHQKSKEYEKAIAKKTKERFDNIDHLLRGQSEKEIQKAVDAMYAELTDAQKEESDKDGNYQLWAKAFDGSGINGWWE